MGSGTIESNDMCGDRTILSHVGMGQFFAETYAYLKDCRVALLSLEGARHGEAGAEAWRLKLVTNLLTVATRKNLILSGRSFHTAPKTVRGRVLSYLNSVSLQKNSTDFDISFDR